MTAARPPVPDGMQLKVNVARALATAIIEGAATDRERSLALAVRQLAEAIERLATEVRR